MLTMASDAVSDAAKEVPVPAEQDFFSDEARPLDGDVAARVLRKVDLFLVPAMVIGTLPCPDCDYLSGKLKSEQVMALFTGTR